MNPKPIVNPNAIYSREEAARLLGISLTTLKQLIRAGHLVVSRPVGIRRIFIKGSNILDMLEQTILQPSGLSSSNKTDRLDRSLIGHSIDSSATHSDARLIELGQDVSFPNTASWVGEVNSRQALPPKTLRQSAKTRGGIKR